MTVLAWLDSLHIHYRVLEYPAHITTSTAAASFLGIEENQMLKSLLVKVGEEFVMILTPLTKRLNMDTLIGYFSVKKARMATPDEVFTVTGYKVGYTCPFLLKSPVRTFIDQTVIKYDLIAISSGEKEKEIMLAVTDLLRLLPIIVLEA